jgi:hypothetical protein
MSEKTEILLAQENKQSAVETEIYDHAAQFYDYGESAENKTIFKEKNRPNKGIILTGSLIVFGGFFLFSSLAAAFYYFSEEIFPTATVNQVDAKDLPKVEDGDAFLGESGNEQKGFEAEKSVKPNFSGDKNIPDNFVKKEIVNPSETKTTKTTAQNDENPLPNRNSTKLSNTIDSSSKTSDSKLPNSTFPQQVVQNNETPIVQNDPKRDFRISSPLIKPSQTQQIPRQNQPDLRTQNNSGDFRNFPQNRREFIIKKIKQSNPEQRSKIRDKLQNRRRKN